MIYDLPSKIVMNNVFMYQFVNNFLVTLVIYPSLFSFFLILQTYTFFDGGILA